MNPPDFTPELTKLLVEEAELLSKEWAADKIRQEALMARVDAIIDKLDREKGKPR